MKKAGIYLIGALLGTASFPMDLHAVCEVRTLRLADDRGRANVASFSGLIEWRYSGILRTAGTGNIISQIDRGSEATCPTSTDGPGELAQGFDQAVRIARHLAPGGGSGNVDLSAALIVLPRQIVLDNDRHNLVIGNHPMNPPSGASPGTTHQFRYNYPGGFTPAQSDTGLAYINAKTNFPSSAADPAAFPFKCASAGQESVILRNLVILSRLPRESSGTIRGIFNATDDQKCLRDGGDVWICNTELNRRNTRTGATCQAHDMSPDCRFIDPRDVDSTPWCTRAPGPDPDPGACRFTDMRACGPDALLTKDQANRSACFAFEVCTNRNRWSECHVFVSPTNETCNGKDDDCDGQVDEGVCQECAPGAWRACGEVPQAGRGICQRGTQVCGNDARWGACEGVVTPQPLEVCNGLDDDCDGQVDEGACQECAPGARRACGEVPQAGRGICQRGTQVCSPDSRWGDCEGIVNPQPLEACNGLDDDCDGQVDEGTCLECAPGARRACGNVPQAGIGLCKNGIQACAPNGQWGACEGIVIPQEEACNHLDDDCDGCVDCYDADGDGLGEDQDGDGRADPNCDPTACEAQSISELDCQDERDDDCDGMRDCADPDCAEFPQCEAGACNKCDEARCAQSVFCKDTDGDGITPVAGDCDNYDAKVAPSALETCDGKDNDCNGSTDITFSGELTPICPVDCNDSDPTVHPGAEDVCDSADNNCDGVIDPDCPTITPDPSEPLDPANTPTRNGGGCSLSHRGSTSWMQLFLIMIAVGPAGLVGIFKVGRKSM